MLCGQIRYKDDAKRVKGYAAIGYKIKGDMESPSTGNIIFDVTNFLPIFTADLRSAKREVVIVSPFLARSRMVEMLRMFGEVISSGVKVTVVTRSAFDYAEKDRARVALLIQMLKSSGIAVVERSKVHQKFAVVDGYVVWYGSINLLSYGNAKESIMRLENKVIAGELLGGALLDVFILHSLKITIL